MKNLNNSGFSMMELMVAVGLSSIIAIFGQQAIRDNARLQNKMLEVGDKKVSATLAQEVIYFDLLQSFPGFGLTYPDLRTEKFWDARNLDKELALKKLGDKISVVRLHRNARNIGAHLLSPSAFYKISGNNISFNMKRIAGKLVSLKIPLKTFVLLSSPIPRKNKRYAIVVYLESAKKVIVTEYSSVDLSGCRNSKGKEPIDQFFRCMPPTGGTNFLKVEPVEIVQYGIEEIERGGKKIKGLVRSSARYNERNGEVSFDAKFLLSSESTQIKLSRKKDSTKLEVVVGN